MPDNFTLVGVWTTRAEYHAIPGSPASLVFQSDGTGWFEIANDYRWETNFFQWQYSSPGWIAIAAIKRLEPHVYTRKTTEVPLAFAWIHLPYEIYDAPKRLQIEWPQANHNGLDLGENIFELASADADAQNKPQR